MKTIPPLLLSRICLILLAFSFVSCNNTPNGGTSDANQSEAKENGDIITNENRNQMTVYKIDDAQVLQAANEQVKHIQKTLDIKDAPIKLNVSFEISESAEQLHYHHTSKKARITSSAFLESNLRPSLEKMGFESSEADMIFAVFFQNFSPIQSIYECILSETDAEYNPNYYRHSYEKSLCAFHFWMDHSSAEEQNALKSLTSKLLERMKNPIPDGEFLSFYIAEHPEIIAAAPLNWLYLQAYIYDDLAGYVEHTSFEDYIAYLLEDIR